jgi:hypothetical protein
MATVHGPHNFINAATGTINPICAFCGTPPPVSTPCSANPIVVAAQPGTFLFSPLCTLLLQISLCLAGPALSAAPAVPVVLWRDLSPLPPPIEFRASAVAGYQQCDLQENDRILPFILEPSILPLLDHFVQNMPSSPQYLMICGPVKSGKSTILERIVPGLIARHHQSLGNVGRHPVILSYSFVGHKEPESAAINFCFFLSTHANHLGLNLVPPVVNHLDTFDQYVRAFSQAVQDKNGMLVLLLDEIQVCCCVDVLLFDLSACHITFFFFFFFFFFRNHFLASTIVVVENSFQESSQSLL